MHHCFLLSVTISSFGLEYVTSKVDFKGQNRLTNQTQLSNPKYTNMIKKAQNCPKGLNGQNIKNCQKVKNG